MGVERSEQKKTPELTTTVSPLASIAWTQTVPTQIYNTPLFLSMHLYQTGLVPEVFKVSLDVVGAVDFDLSIECVGVSELVVHFPIHGLQENRANITTGTGSSI